MSTGKSKTPPGGNAAGLDLSGRTIADYRVERSLGQGGMGQVYLAEQISLKRPVALKVLRPELAANAESVQRFEAEAKAAARASHPHIVQVYGFGVFEGLAYIAMEYVDGRNLKEHIARKGPPELPVAISIMRQVASALQRAGELGVIHRDIKPENILLTRKGEAKVGDFGLSRCLQGDEAQLSLTRTGVTMGTPLYMSPEQVEGKPLDPRTDIYSFGVTCYFMLSGQPPFRGNSAFEVALQHVRSKPVPLSEVRPDLPPGLCRIVHKMLAKVPARRYQTGKDLVRDIVHLREALSGVNSTSTIQPALPIDPATETATPAGGSATIATELPRRAGVRRLLAAMRLSILAGAGGGAALAWKGRRAAPAPGPEGPVADATVLEGLQLPSQHERDLRDAAERYLRSPRGKALERIDGVGVCAELGLYYLERDRLDDAGKLFARLEQIDGPPGLALLGQLGQGIVLALRNQPRRSNASFARVFQLSGNGQAQLKKLLEGKKGPGRKRLLDEALWIGLEPRLGPIGPLLRAPLWRYWIARARWYNHENGLPDSNIPLYLRRIPLPEGPPAPKQDGGAKEKGSTG